MLYGVFRHKCGRQSTVTRMSGAHMYKWSLLENKPYTNLISGRFICSKIAYLL